MIIAAPALWIHHEQPAIIRTNDLAIFPFPFFLGVAALSAPINLGTAGGTNSGATSMVITTSGNVPTGSTIVVACMVNNTGSTGASSVTDSASNTYTSRIDVAMNSTGYGAVQFWEAHNVSALSSGSSITIAFASGQRSYVAAAAATNAQTNPYDTKNNTTGSNTSSGSHAISLTTASNNEIAFGIIWGQNTGDLTNDGTWTALTAPTTQGSSAGQYSEFVWAYKLFPTAGSATYTPSSSTGGNGWQTGIVAFKQ